MLTDAFAGGVLPPAKVDLYTSKLIFLYKLIYRRYFLMSVSLYFGLPGCGKTTTMCCLMVQALKTKKYRNVYCNVHNKIPGVTYIDNECIGKYDLSDALLCIDEATLFADNRDFKNFSKGRLMYFLEHRHFNVDIILFTQQWDGIDKKIRVITDRVYYVYKGLFTGHWFSRAYRVPYGIIIPDKKSSAEKLGEIVQGYCKPGLFGRLFGKWVFRPKYYQYFDSWERPYLPPLPEVYHANPSSESHARRRYSSLFNYSRSKLSPYLRTSCKYGSPNRIRRAGCVIYR